jgi:hypothetical protein
MPRPRKLSDEDMAALAVMVQADAPCKAIMARFGIGRTRVWMLKQEIEKNVHEHLRDSSANQNGAHIAGDAA